MINPKTGQRELCYLVKVDDIIPIEGAVNVETAAVGGWRIMVHKNEFKAGDIAVYFEIDSKVPATEPFMFLEPKHFKIKTQKYFKGTVISQGLLMSLEDFIIRGNVPEWLANVYDRMEKGENVEHTFLTKELGVTYAESEDEARKAVPAPSKKPSNALVRKLEKSRFGRRILRFLFPDKKIVRTNFPTQFPYVTRSDEERCENLPPDFLEDKTPYRKTLKIDGTSTLFLLERIKKNKFEFYVCSRSKRILDENEKTFHDTNVYWEMAKKYDVENVLKEILWLHPKWDYVAIQGETAGVGVQGNPHKLPDTRFYCFNFIEPEKGRWDSLKAKNYLRQFKIPFVPIVDENYILPDDFEEFKLSADGPIELEDGHGMREGYVYRSSADPMKSFKNVSREYLLKHNG